MSSDNPKEQKQIMASIIGRLQQEYRQEGLQIGRQGTLAELVKRGLLTQRQADEMMREAT